MNDQELVINYQPFPGNVPGEGYIPVTTKASQDPPSTSDHWRYEKLTQVTDADKQQIQTNKNNITTLQGQVSTLEEEIEDVPTDVYTKSETNTLLGQKQDTLVAGANITIQGNVISAAGGGTPIDAYTKAETDALLDDKVDKVTGKGLSTNDFTNADKTKLDGIDMSTKQDVLTTAQMNAVNSGITAAKVAEIDDKAEVSGTNDGTNWTNITINGTTKAIPSGGGGGFTPTQAQLDAMNSGIDSTKVAQIATNTSDIANKVDKVTGKGLSTNDYTTADQTKVGYIGNGVETLTFTLADSSTVTLKVVKGA